MKIEHKKIFRGPSKILKNISWPINVCLKWPIRIVLNEFSTYSFYRFEFAMNFLVVINKNRLE